MQLYPASLIQSAWTDKQKGDSVMGKIYQALEKAERFGDEPQPETDITLFDFDLSNEMNWSFWGAPVHP